MIITAIFLLHSQAPQKNCVADPKYTLQNNADPDHQKTVHQDPNYLLLNCIV